MVIPKRVKVYALYLCKDARCAVLCISLLVTWIHTHKNYSLVHGIVAFDYSFGPSGPCSCNFAFFIMCSSVSHSTSLPHCVTDNSPK
jgi:hypothetical protein